MPLGGAFVVVVDIKEGEETSLSFRCAVYGEDLIILVFPLPTSASVWFLVAKVRSIGYSRAWLLQL